MKRTAATLLAAILMLGSVALSQDRQQSLAATPPMGWNSWNKFACNVSQDLIHQVADAMVASGMKDAGYQYVIIDDCWQVDRDGNGNIVPDPRRFPSGMKALAEFSAYSSGTDSSCIQERQCVRNWVTNPANTVNRAFTAILTGTPEPEVWLLWGAALQ